ncbi:MAG: hypothetical protein HYV32_02590 [Candidatus Kerfeldbacteria bacterium]|nr:hypothetical protein [Candidatus Kerfeldbacteria bacterium]
MRVYIHDEKTGGAILRACREAGVSVLTPEKIRKRKRLPEGVAFFLDQVDLLIIEITKPNPLMHFILAQAILADKPTLCLYAKNQSPRLLLKYIRKKATPKPVKTFSYMETSLAEAVNHFIGMHDPLRQEHDEAVSIKYTLRLSPRVDRYLTWRSEKQKMNKADFIRELLARKAKEDRKYRDPLME